MLLKAGILPTRQRNFRSSSKELIMNIVICKYPTPINDSEALSRKGEVVDYIFTKSGFAGAKLEHFIFERFEIKSTGFKYPVPLSEIVDLQ